MKNQFDTPDLNLTRKRPYTPPFENPGKNIYELNSSELQRLASLEPVEDLSIQNLLRHKYHQPELTTCLIFAARFIMALHVLYANKTKAELKNLNNCFSITILSNMQMFLEEEVLHILACEGIYRHEPELTRVYSVYSLLLQAARLPFFYYVLQNELNKHVEKLLDDDNYAVLNVSLVLASYVLLCACSMLYSELLRPQQLLKTNPRGLFFREATSSPIEMDDPYLPPAMHADVLRLDM